MDTIGYRAAFSHRSCRAANPGRAGSAWSSTRTMMPEPTAAPGSQPILSKLLISSTPTTVPSHKEVTHGKNRGERQDQASG